jgi:DNA polymerase
MKPRKTAKPTGSAADFIPPRPTLTKLRAAAQHCRGCDLYTCGTQTVFGEGPSRARVLVVGEQPGDAEDKAGKPFVGPSGKLLDRAFEAAGIDRDDVYVTNAVKHFKWAKDARTKRRIHKTPNAGEIRACRPWLDHEIAIVQPDVIVCLGATAAKSLLGKSFSVTKSRAVPVNTELAGIAFATVHPSSVLRAPSEERARAEKMFIADMQKVGRYLEKLEHGARKAERAGRPRRKLPAWPTTAHRSGTSSESTRSSRG